VAASIFPLYDIVRRVAGERLVVELVLPPGQTTHFFDPRPRDVARLEGVTLVFAVGLGLDQWLEGVLAATGGRRATLFALGPLLDPILAPGSVAGAEAGKAASGSIDPHFWLDPVRMHRATDIVVDALGNVDPQEAVGYRARGDLVKRSLAELHDETARRAAGWRRRTIVTFHGSLFYFADRYRLTVAAVVEPVPGREPTARHLAQTIATIREADVAALFTEPQLDRAPAQALARETGVPLLEIDPVGGAGGLDSYEKLIRHNVSVLGQALQ
jgi:zinc transport system substrate-binding protein